MALENNQNRRWYDQHQDVGDFVAAILLFPDRVRQLLCLGLMDKAEQEFQIQEMLQSVRSLGADKITMVLKASRKQRKYDKTSNLHRTMNAFSVLPDEDRTELTLRANALIKMTVDYFSLCNDFRQAPTMEGIARVSKTYLDEGPEICRAHLQSIREVFEIQRGALAETLQIQPPPPEPPPKPKMEIDDKTMRIRPDSK